MEELEKLQKLIRDLLQVEYSDLDFGLYRMLRLKRDEVEAFITKQLPDEVDRAFAAVADSELTELRRQVEELAAKLREEVNEGILSQDGSVVAERAKGLGKKDKALVDRYSELRDKLVSSEATVADKADVFNHLYNFFSRYYEDGDFIPKRRYGDRGTYAVPWDGSEVLFHWANKDQHYVKTSETLKDYTFTLPGDLADKMTWRVRFVLVEASVPKDNVKGEDRFFFPRPDAIECDSEKHECRIGFEYRPPTEQEIIKYRAAATGRKPDQEKMLSGDDSHGNVTALLKKVPETELRRRLSADTRSEEQIREGKPAEPVPLLLKRIRHFVKRSTTDYFVHKNLRGFLREELEFYVKDQVLHVGDIEGDLPARLRMLKVLRRLAEQVIDFLAQMEDAQKRLFEKRKFVTETSWLIPIQSVPESFWPDVVANKAQRQQWKDWLAVEPEEFFGKKGKIDLPFLRGHPTLVVDTRLFPAHWTARLLESLPFDDLDEATEGLLVQSENYQALRALAPLLSGQIHATYIDPPYNTNATEILYKNGFKQSSWISLMEERLAQARQYMHHDGVLCVTIDDYEGSKLWMTLEGRLGPGNHLGTAVIRSNPGGRKAKRKLAAQHEYAFFFAANENVKVAKWPVLPEEKTHDYQQESDGRWYEERNLRKEGQDSLATDDSERYYPIWFDPRSGRLSSTHKFSVEILPVDSSGVKRIWRRDKADIDTLYDAGDLNHKLTRFGHQVCFKFRGGSEEETPKSMWTDPKYSAGEHGSGVLKDLFGREVFPFPKSVHAVEDCCRVMTARTDASILDYFAGSGTTGHAVVNLNRADGGHRRFTLVDMGEYFNSVLVPRIAKVMYTPEWKDGKPKRLATKEEAERMPQLVKVLRLESYEEALHNVASDTNQQRTARRDHAHRSAGGDEEYRIRYLVSLRLEASDTMLNLEKLERPFDYTLEMLTDDGPKQKQADLVETFNYLYGLRVKRCETWQHEGREYRVVKATDREQRRPILVIWRDMADLKPAPEREFLEGRLRELASKGEVYDEKLINGDCAVPGIDSLDPLFKRLMTAGEDESS